MCDNLAERGELYCAEHGRLTQQRAQQHSSVHHVTQTCHGLNKKGKPCKTRGSAPHNVKFFCDAHVDQVFSSEEDTGSEDQDWVMADGEEAEPAAPTVTSTGWLAAGILGLASSAD
jgi:hypothetical protein